MKKIWKRIAVMAICLLMLAMIVPVRTAEAATVNSAKFTVAEYGANKTTFYVKATNKKEVKIGYTCTKGYIYSGKYSNEDWNNILECYGYYEVQVWGKQGSTWIPIYAKSEETQKNIKNSKSNSSFLKVKGYEEYKVAIYAWNTKNFASTVKNNYGKCSTPHYFKYRSVSDYLFNQNPVAYPSIKLSFSNCKSIG